MKRLFVVLALALQIAPAPAQTPVASPVAASVWNEFQAVRWGMPYADWRRTRRPAECEPFGGPGPADGNGDNGIGGVELWSYRCREAAQSTSALWFFYAFDPREPVVAGLEQFRISVEGLPLDQLTTLHGELSNRLVARYGVGESPAPRSVTEWGSSYWRNTLRWQNADVQIYLYIEQFPYAKPVGPVLSERQRVEGPRLKLQVRHRLLLDTMAAFQRLERAQYTLRWGQSGTPLDTQLAKQLSGEFPRSAALLASPERPVDEQPALLPAAIELLDAAGASTGERRAMLLVAADRLAGRLREGERNSPSWDASRRRLSAYGLNFEWTEPGASWLYTHGLLRRIWQEHPDTAWGSVAFLHLLSSGWNTGIGCRDGIDRFRDVIARGEEFLRARPRTPDRAQIVLFVAQSYETWWSLSRANAEREIHIPDLGVYQEGAATARRKAIEYYNELLRLPGTTDEAAYARLALPRLKLGIDTGQRRFICFYD
jgi:hypothetical protein